MYIVKGFYDNYNSVYCMGHIHKLFQHSYLLNILSVNPSLYTYHIYAVTAQLIIKILIGEFNIPGGCNSKVMLQLSNISLFRELGFHYITLYPKGTYDQNSTALLGKYINLFRIKWEKL